MTATITGPYALAAADVNLDLVLQRADRRYANEHCADPAEPGYLATLAAAVEAQLVDQPRPAVPAQRRGESAGHNQVPSGPVAATSDNTGGAAADAAQLADRIAELEQALSLEKRRTADLAGIGEQHAAALAENVELVDQLDAARGEREQMGIELAQLRSEVQTLRTKVSKATKSAKATKTATAAKDEPPAAPHRHRYPWLEDTGTCGPCECGKPYPRVLDDVDEDGQPFEDVVPDVEPVDAVLAQLRTTSSAAGPDGGGC